MKPIAVVYWMDEGNENKKTIYLQQDLDRYTRTLRSRNWVFWICMCSGQASITPRKREVTAEAFKASGHIKNHPRKTGA